MPSFTTTHEGHMLFSTRVGEHTVEVDSPLTMGGADRAPTSPQLMVAALGSCIAAFVVEYGMRSGIDCTGLTVDVAFETSGTPVRLHDFKVTVDLPEADCGARREAIRRVAEQCPVHRTMAAFDGLEVVVRDRGDLAGGEPGEDARAACG